MRLYPDHETAGLYYYIPGPLELKEVDGRPAFDFTRIGYLGRRRTQDQGVLRNRGVITFTVRQGTAARELDRIATALARGDRPAVLKPLPLEEVRLRLVYQAVRPGGTAVAGEILPREGGPAGGPVAELWRERTLVMVLDPADAALLWDAFQQERLVLSLAYTLVAAGRERTEEGGTAPARREVGGALAVRVSPRSHPDLFHQVDLGARMQVGYGRLDVYCFDFVDGRAGGLYSKIVQVRFRSLRGDDVVRQVTFRAGEATYHQTLDFPYAKAVNQSYDYRVLTVGRDGERTIGPWVTDNDDSFLDVSATPAGGEAPAAPEVQGLY